jgi:hypothetical protein
MLLKKGLDKPSQLQPREQTQVGRLVLIRPSEYRYGIAKAAFERGGSKVQPNCQKQWMIALKLQYVIQMNSAKRRENHLALKAHGWGQS